MFASEAKDAMKIDNLKAILRPVGWCLAISFAVLNLAGCNGNASGGDAASNTAAPPTDSAAAPGAAPIRPRPPGVPPDPAAPGQAQTR